MTDLDAIRARHVKTDDDGGPDYCLMDGLPWPCDTHIVLAALDDMRGKMLEARSFCTDYVILFNDTKTERDAAIKREARLRAHFQLAAGISYDLWLAVATDDELATTPEGE